MRVKLLALALPVLGALMACGPTDPPPPEPAQAPPAPATQAPAARGYTLVLLKTGPMSGQLPKEENDKLFAGHFSNMERMTRDGQLVVAGPFGEKRHDPALRGIFVLDTAMRAEAEAWAGTDPPSQAGVFQLEFHDLATNAPLRRALEADMARRDEQVAQGKNPGPGAGARPYVLLTAESGEAARRELGPLQSSEGGVYLLAALDGGRALAILDAADLAMAGERFAAPLANLGPHALDEWYASDQLARLHELGP